MSAAANGRAGRVLVTGAAGFIGGHCCDALLRQGRPVIGLDNFDPFYAREMKQTVVEGLRGREGFELVEGDIRDRALVERLARGAEILLHLAARPGVRASLDDPAGCYDVNVTGTAVLLTACREAGLGRVVFGSSSSVYGDATPAPFREDTPALDPLSPYAASKQAGELLCSVFTRRAGFRVAILRFFTVYGPGQRPDLAIRRFTSLLLGGAAIPRFGDGSSERDYTYIDDAVAGVLGAVDWVARGGPACEAINLAGGRTVRLDRLIELLSEALGVSAQVEPLPDVPGDAKRTWGDISKAARLLGYQPRVTLEEGLRRFGNWYRRHHPGAPPVRG